MINTRPKVEDQKYYKLEEAARGLGITYAKILRLIHSAKLPVILESGEMQVLGFDIVRYWEQHH